MKLPASIKPCQGKSINTPEPNVKIPIKRKNKTVSPLSIKSIPKNLAKILKTDMIKSPKEFPILLAPVCIWLPYLS